MRRIHWIVAPAAAVLSLGALPAEALPTQTELPELLLPAPKPLRRPSARMDRQPSTQLDLGDYNVPGERVGHSAVAPLPARV